MELSGEAQALSVESAAHRAPTEPKRPRTEAEDEAEDDAARGEGWSGASELLASLSEELEAEYSHSRNDILQ